MDGPILIARDTVGVRQIRAATEHDTQLGLGHVHAQARLWQMEWQRRLASGLGNRMIAIIPLASPLGGVTWR
jgi:penicillin amidase